MAVLPADRVLQNTAGGEVVPYGRTAGDVPYHGGQNVAPAGMPAGAIPYVSDTPAPTVAYNDRPTCIGTKRNGDPCKAKARNGAPTCEAHQAQS
jgi:hypothetical protein